MTKSFLQLHDIIYLKQNLNLPAPATASPAHLVTAL